MSLFIRFLFIFHFEPSIFFFFCEMTMTFFFIPFKSFVQLYVLRFSVFKRNAFVYSIFSLTMSLKNSFCYHSFVCNEIDEQLDTHKKRLFKHQIKWNFICRLRGAYGLNERRYPKVITE